MSHLHELQDYLEKNNHLSESGNAHHGELQDLKLPVKQKQIQ